MEFSWRLFVFFIILEAIQRYMDPPGIYLFFSLFLVSLFLYSWLVYVLIFKFHLEIQNPMLVVIVGGAGLAVNVVGLSMSHPSPLPPLSHSLSLFTSLVLSLAQRCVRIPRQVRAPAQCARGQRNTTHGVRSPEKTGIFHLLFRGKRRGREDSCGPFQRIFLRV